MENLNIDLNNIKGNEVLNKELSDRLTPLLEEDLCKKTGLNLGNGLQFFILVFKAKSIAENLSCLKGDLIGPDAVLTSAEAKWEEFEDGTLKAWWSDLDAEFISQRYGK